MNTFVVYTTMATIAGRLEGAAHEIIDCADSAPESVDAGDANGVLLAMLATAMDAAAALAEGIGSAGLKIRESLTVYQGQDDAAAADLRRLDR